MKTIFIDTSAQKVTRLIYSARSYKHETGPSRNILAPRNLRQITTTIGPLEYRYSSCTNIRARRNEGVPAIIHIAYHHTTDLVQTSEDLSNEIKTSTHILLPPRCIPLPHPSAYASGLGSIDRRRCPVFVLKYRNGITPGVSDVPNISIANINQRVWEGIRCRRDNDLRACEF